MKFGLMTQIQMPRPWTDTTEREAYWHTLDQVVFAEDAGFGYFWITEQHFFIEIGHSSCPDMVLAALSQRTKTIRLGFGVILMPCHNPFMVAERVATLDVLSRGRAEFGAGRGTTPYVVEGLGFDPSIGREVGRESMDAVLSMFEHELFPGYKGQHFDLPVRHVVPRPIQRPHPPIWVAASNLETYEHAGRQGFGVIGVTRNTPAETKPFVDGYRAAIRNADASTLVARVKNDQNGVFAISACHEDDRTGREIACAATRWYFGDNDAELNRLRFSTAGGVGKVNDKIASRSNDKLIEDAMAIGGNPDTVCRQVEKWANIGVDQMIFFLQAGRTTHDQVMRSIELIGEKVIPRFATREDATDVARIDPPRATVVTRKAG
jgi:alkanesulfonate monooxygenase SsuD/methylene tetrahydromethanopterin reductase-like flavin-dependent oxidoreductase (luciferase family)